jgi:hypothetical protein
LKANKVLEMTKKKVILLILCIAFLVLGLLLYFVFNQDAYISKVLHEVIHFQINTNDSLPVSIIKFYGADLLWSIAFVLAIQAVLGVKRKQIWLLMFCSLLGVVYELMQYFSITNGVADIFDVFAYITGSFIGVSIILGGKFYEKT